MDSDEGLMYERACLVRPRGEVKPEPMVEEDHQDLDRDEDLPFYMSQIKTAGVTEEPDRETRARGYALCGPDWSRKRK